MWKSKATTPRRAVRLTVLLVKEQMAVDHGAPEGRTKLELKACAVPSAPVSTRSKVLPLTWSVSMTGLVVVSDAVVRRTTPSVLPVERPVHMLLVYRKPVASAKTKFSKRMQLET